MLYGIYSTYRDIDCRRRQTHPLCMYVCIEATYNNRRFISVFFGFCFEIFFHRPCVTYGKSENHTYALDYYNAPSPMYSKKDILNSKKKGGKFQKYCTCEFQKQ